MSRHLYGGGSADFAIIADEPSGNLKFQPGTTVTMWDSATGGNQVTDLLSIIDEALTTVTTGSTGEIGHFYGPDGWASILYADGGVGPRRALVPADLAAEVATKLGRDEEPAGHAHSVSDLPDVQRALAAGLTWVTFDSTSNTWPLVELPPGRIVWDDNGSGASPPAQARGGFDLWFGPLTGPTNVPDPTPEPDPEDPTENPDNVTLYAPVASVNGSSVALTAQVDTSVAKTFRYLQIAVRGPSGQIADVGHAPNTTVDGSTTLAGGFVASQTGTWRAYAAYNLTGGSAQSDWTDGPAVDFGVTLPTPGDPTPGGIPLVGRSGLDLNLGVFVGGTDVASADYFVTYLGRNIDAYLTFTSRASWDQMFTIHSSWAPFITGGGIVVVSNPPQPEPSKNSATAAGTNNQRWRDYGTALTAAGLNSSRFVKRLGWECNGNWYWWSWGSPDIGKQNTPESYIAAVKNVSDSIKTTAPNIKLSVNFNRNNKRTGYDWRTLLGALLGNGPTSGLPYFDIVGIDSYDMYNAATNASTWTAQSNQDPGPVTLASWCRANGKQLAYEEWAPIRSGGANGTGGGDNPYYCHAMADLMRSQTDILAYSIAYEHEGTNDYSHSWVPSNSPDYPKPNFSAAFLEEFGV
jgi:hypothetical protein